VGSQRGKEHQTCPPRTYSTYRQSTSDDDALIGYSVEAIDGNIGKIDEDSNEVEAATSSSTPALDLRQESDAPAGVISSVGPRNTTVHVNRTKDQIKHHEVRREHISRRLLPNAKSGRTTALAASAGKTGSRSFVVVGATRKAPELNTASVGRSQNLGPKLSPEPSPQSELLSVSQRHKTPL